MLCPYYRKKSRLQNFLFVHETTLLAGFAITIAVSAIAIAISATPFAVFAIAIAISATPFAVFAIAIAISAIAIIAFGLYHFGLCWHDFDVRNPCPVMNGACLRVWIISPVGYRELTPVEGIGGVAQSIWLDEKWKSSSVRGNSISQKPFYQRSGENSGETC
jgi:hypothetical protein